VKPGVGRVAARAQALDETESLGLQDFFRMEQGGVRVEAGRRIRTFWNEQGRCFELDAQGRGWRAVPRIGPRPDRNEG
jgi:hypothetical protein